MRLIRTKIYRAFPELDRFDDARCERFIQAARGGTGRRLTALAKCILVSIVILVVPPIARGLIVGWIESVLTLRSDLAYPTYVGASLIAMIAAPTIGLLTRDALIRRRVRFILRSRCTCLTCQNSLLGLPIEPDLMVTCPRCQFASRVDEAIGELSPAADGASRSSSNPHMRHWPWIQERAKQKVRSVVWIAFSSLAMATALSWGFYEVFLWRQAQQAIALKPGAAGLLTYAQTLQPTKASEQDQDGWNVYLIARRKQGNIDAILGQSRPPKVNDESVSPDFYEIYAPTPANELSEASRLFKQASLSEAERYLKAYDDQGLWKAYDAMAETRRCIMPLNLPADMPAFAIQLSELTEARKLMKVLAARMTAAARRGDGQEVATAYRPLLTLARMTQMQPLGFQYLVGVSIECTAFERVCSLLRTHPDTFTLETLDSLIKGGIEQEWTPPPNHPWEGDRLCNIDTAAWVFSSSSRVRFGKFSPELRRSSEIFSPADANQPVQGDVGTLDSVVAEFNERAMAQAHRAAMTYADRRKTPESIVTSNLLVKLLAISCDPLLEARDTRQLLRNGTAALLLIERFRRVNGRVPNSLEEARGNDTRASLTDPFSGKPLLYKRVDSQADKLQRPYLLYGVGSDMRDDGGATSPAFPRYAALKASASKTQPALDFVINDDR
ncbi:MAG: hypothetical protein NTV94_13530 [Planctomycetota bacterium]|nr:hypothetical protein [Planctomycetota bacterium]